MKQVTILSKPFNPLDTLNIFQETHLKGACDYGATAMFVGTMRDFNEGDDVSEMLLEHYPAMTEKQLYAIIDQAESRWPLLHVLLCHRVGVINPADPIVLVSVWSAHRAAAFDACRFLMEALKHQAPFWKKERLSSGESRWVEKNTDGTSSL